MSAPYGLELIDNCVDCERHDDSFFCGLQVNALRGLDSIKFATVYPQGVVLFAEGQIARGVYVLCAGRVKLSTSSGNARMLITQIAGSGEILGLSATLADLSYEVTAETLEPCRINFIKRDDFLRFLNEHTEVSLRIAQQLSQHYRDALKQVRLLGLSNSAAGKFARFLLQYGVENGDPAKCDHKLKLTLTHEEIGQLICASRETVTRLFSSFKNQQFIEVKGATLRLLDRSALEDLADD